MRKNKRAKRVKSKRGITALWDYLLKIGVALMFVVALLFLIPSALNAGYKTVLGILGLGQSADDFGKGIDTLTQKAAVAATQNDLALQLQIDEQIIKNWESFAQSRNAGSISGKTRTQIALAYQTAFDIDYTRFSATPDCTNSPIDPLQFEAKCQEVILAFASAHDTGMPLKTLTAQQYQFFNKIADNLERSWGTYTVSTLKEKSQEEIDKVKGPICSNTAALIKLCTYLDESASPDDTAEDSACAHTQAYAGYDIPSNQCVSS